MANPTAAPSVPASFWEPSINQPGSQPTEQLGNPRADRPDDQPSEEAGHQRNDKYGGTDQMGNHGNDISGTSRTTMIATVGQNTAEIDWQYAGIERLDEYNLSTRLIPFHLVNALDNRACPDNQLLRAGDVAAMFSRADLDLPIEKHASFVRVGGEFNSPGVCGVNPGETFSFHPSCARGTLRRATEQMQRELVARHANATPTAGQTAGDQQTQLSLQRASLAWFAAIKPTGRVVPEMKPDAGNPVRVSNGADRCRAQRHQVKSCR